MSDAWRRQYEFVETSGLADDEAALVWISAVLGITLPRPLHAALRGGDVLCRLLNKIRPGSVKGSNEEPSGSPFQQLSRIDAYLKACKQLDFRQTFMSVDLHDQRDLRAVVRQL